MLRIEKTIHFEGNQIELNESQLDELNTFLASVEDMIPEKVDITGFCTGSKASFHCLKKSRERSIRIYNFLHERIEEEDVFEMRVANNDGGSKENVIVVIGYFLEDDAPAVGADVLFPEEFEDAFPSCLIRRTDFSEERFLLKGVEFVGNSATLLETAYPSLNSFAKHLKKNTSIQVHIEGFVNGSGGGKYLKNQGNPEKVQYKNGKHLSEARASNVMDYLVSEGVDPTRIDYVGKGGSNKLFRKPQNEAENAANRRIEVILTQ